MSQATAVVKSGALSQLKAAQTTVAALIASIEAGDVKLPRSFSAPIDLAEGELYAGVILGKNGEPGHHLVLLAGETSANWSDAKDWALKAGGDLPTRREQSLLFANLAEEFQSDWYWSSEQYSEKSAFIQHFSHGGQGSYDYKSASLRARAVRRLPF